MDRGDGSDIRHYDSTEAFSSTRQVVDSQAAGTEAASESDEYRSYSSADGSSGNGIEQDARAGGGPDELGPVDDADVADTYGEPSADLDFDPDADSFGMGTGESDDMLADETDRRRVSP